MSQSETWRQHPATAEELAGAVLGLVERSDTVTFGELAKWMAPETRSARAARRHAPIGPHDLCHP
jgi:hypothetical protein